jgi:hypothetical protein
VSRVRIPVKKWDGGEWGEISALGPTLTYEIVGEDVRLHKEKYTFSGGHRVRLFKFKKNVHFRLPEGTKLDITAVPDGVPPPRRQSQQQR